MLDALGWRADPSELHPQQGAWRTAKHLDVLAWEGRATHPGGLKVDIGSWDTMTKLVRRGFTISKPGESMSGCWELHAKMGARVLAVSDDEAREGRMDR